MSTRFIGVALAVMLVAVGPAKSETITIAGSEWCPYNCAQESPLGLGYMVEIARAVFEPGITVDYILLNWARAIEEVQQGRMNALVGSSKRDGFVFTDEPQGVAQNGFALRAADTFTYEGPQSLSGRSLGVIAGYTYTEELDKYIDANKNNKSLIQAISGDAALSNNLRKLAAGRVDLVVDDINVLRQQIKFLGLTDALKVVPGGPADPVYIAFSAALPQSQAYARQLQEGVARLRASGRLQTILDRYNVSDWQ